MNFGTLFLIVVASLAGPLFSGIKRFPVPLVVGQIAAGIVIGTSGFNLIKTNDPALQFMSSIGLAMLMFLVGTNLPLRNPDLKGVLKHSIGATILGFFVAAPFAWALSVFTSVHQMGILLLLLACSSSAVIGRIVNELRMDGKLVLLITAWVAVADISSVIALPLALSPKNLVPTLIGAAVITGTAILSLWGLRWFKESEFGDHYRQLSKERGWALDLRLSLVILFGLTWLALRFGTSVLIAGFAAGAVVSAISQPRRFTKQLIGLAEGFFVPLFFVDLGAKLDMTQLYQSHNFLLITAAIVASSMAVHLIVARVIRLPWEAGLMASAQQGLPIALVSIGLADNRLTPGQGAAIIAATLLLIAISSWATIRLSKRVPIKPLEEPDEKPDPQSDDDDDDETCAVDAGPKTTDDSAPQPDDVPDPDKK